MIIHRIDADIRYKFVALGIWIGVCIDKLRFGGEWCHCSDLSHVSEAWPWRIRTMLMNGVYILTSFFLPPMLAKAPVEVGHFGAS